MAVLLVIGVAGLALVVAVAVVVWRRRSGREPRWWPEFEREFRDYVEGSGKPAPPPAHRRRRP